MRTNTFIRTWSCLCAFCLVRKSTISLLDLFQASAALAAEEASIFSCYSLQSSICPHNLHTRHLEQDIYVNKVRTYVHTLIFAQ